MLGLNGQPYIDLSQFVDLSGYTEIEREIFLGLAKSPNLESSETESKVGGGDHHCPDFDVSQYKLQPTIEDQLTPQDFEDLNQLKNHHERTRWFRMAKGVFHPWTSVQPLMSSVWLAKSHPKPWDDVAQELFPMTIQFIENLNVFKDIGRALIYGVEALHHVIPHRDRNREKYPYLSEFIYINPGVKKPFFVYDQATQSKHFVKTSVAVFNDCDYHGTDALPEFNYSLRIDGMYTEEFKEKIEWAKASESHQRDLESGRQVHEPFAHP